MHKKIIAVAALTFLCLGSVAAQAQVAGEYGRMVDPAVSPYPTQEVGAGDLRFDPLTPDVSALPGRGELPLPANLRDNERARRYTGIIKNKTRYEVSVPSENSDGTLTIPPHSFIEYTIWTRRANVTAYNDGKPFYCLKLWADPSEYLFMCKKYDFMAEIVKPEPTAGKYKPMKKRKYRAKKQPEC
jgi:hypothetical protein